jgi:hypothetical protein
MKKIFEVTVTKTLYVLADDEHEAELEAKTYESEDDGDVQVGSEITSLEQVDDNWRDSIPFGDQDGDMSIRQLLEPLQPSPPVFVDPPEQLKIDFPGGAQPT